LTGEVDVKWHFTDPEAYKQFLLVSDKDHGEGFSHCELKQSPAGKGLFTGYLDTRIPKDGIVKKAGFCGMRTARARVWKTKIAS
jgi:NADH dehydrogenase [ubiquinone] 1 alpha subcomplex assembly factor 1